MSQTRRPEAALVRLLSSLMVFATGALPPASAAQVAVVAFKPPAAFFAPPPLAELEAHGRELQLHLEGREPARLELIVSRVEKLEARLADASQSLAEPDRVRAEIKRIRVLLARIIGPAVTAAAPRPREARVGAAAGTLSAAAAGAPAWIFDGARAPSPRAVAAPPAAFAPAAYAPAARRLPSGFGSDLRINVPAPYAAAPAAPSQLPRRYAGGGSVALLSKRLARVSDAEGKVLSYEAGVADLLLESEADARTALSRAIARELLSALRKPDADGASARQLGDFLRDIAEYRPRDAVSTRLSADGRNHFRLIFERADKSRRVILGQFLTGTARDGKPPRMAFIVMGAIEIDPAGTPRQNHPGYWREYTGDGGRLDWSGTTETQEKGWGPWKRRDEVESSWRTAKSWREGGWSTDSKEKVKTAAAREGLSWFGRAGEKIMAAPVVGSTLKFCDNVAAGIYTSVIGAPQIILADLAGSDLYSIEAGGSYAKNPLVNLFADDETHLSRLRPGARRELYRTVDINRRRALDAGIFPLAPELQRQALDAPVTAKEAVATLRDGYGASTYGKRLLGAAEDLDGWRATAMKAGGMAAGAFENVAEGVSNPILWVTLGAGEAVAALKASSAVASGAIGAKAALTAVSAVHAGATAAWWAPWLLSGTDNLGQVAQLTAKGNFDAAYFAKLGDAGADFLYMFVIP